MSPMGCVCSSRPMVQDQVDVVNNMPPLTSTILANYERRRPGIARQLMREESSSGHAISTPHARFVHNGRTRLGELLQNRQHKLCVSRCSKLLQGHARRTLPGPLGRSVRFGPFMAPRILCQVYTAPRRAGSGTAVAPASNALIEAATGLAAKPQLEATVVKDCPAHQIQGIAGQARDHKLQRAARRCTSISQPEDPQLTSCPSARP
ncbi:hypothetical protein ACVI1K_003570 [Bradyrhizobium sp. USDA 4508]